MKNILFYIALLAFCTGAKAQTLTISGSVLDYDTDEPIPFANVYLHQTTIGVAADFDGKYSITFPAGKADSLVVSAIGYVTAKKKIGKGYPAGHRLSPESRKLLPLRDRRPRGGESRQRDRPAYHPEQRAQQALSIRCLAGRNVFQNRARPRRDRGRNEGPKVPEAL
ncbi:MAG: carboxypeptidase-like regulatory domain-containing protein [Saprospirales bacterium]|nr:carboxypeptidase-like regulatory domain-containing protein [Saprospirales bacterium]